VTTLEELLLKTSRTFALTIPCLPEPTRREVGVAYLLFRIADTLEDATQWGQTQQVAELNRFSALLEAPTEAEAQAVSEEWLSDPPLDHDGYLQLLSEVPYVLEELQGLRPEAAQHIVLHTRRTIARMATFVERGTDDGGLQLRDIPDLQAYCYAVAGIVGEMLTELFLVEREELREAAPQLREQAATFGEALQLVNILKDTSTDVDEGRSYLPRGVQRAEVFQLARRDLEEAGRYVMRLQEAGAERGLIEFTALPVLLAWASLDRIEARGPGSKLSRLEVLQIVRRMGKALDKNRPAVPFAGVAS
jgi:farnesyl-diphosphate farnesyltransferase